jgi:uncharacterized iron-regulated membrane protein
LAAAAVLLMAGGTGAVLVWPTVLRQGDMLTRLHTRMLIGEAGEWLVISATVASAVLVAGGLILWWKRKLLAVSVTRGWWRFLFDLHHSLGIVAAILMLVISLSGVGLVLTEHEDGSPLSPSEQAVRGTIERLHTGREFARPLQVLYALGSLTFVVQGLSGFVMWWKPQVPRGEG